ncbi:hypothetical protein [Malikia spinosa]|jgi:hypothetical protein|uniref:Uncharacterized protein n=1 Tax=Malikia spinosa TaxID=86180 RepID=A0A7C9IXK1_9BURK|nr:hypothetical protein [Malikia spinosa]MYZ52469.1 hypothetical protein [Malikia spinosa]
MEDTRCCGSGTCIINAQGYCWCGQRWDGTRMCFAEAAGSDCQDEDTKLKADTDDGQDPA